MEDLLDLYGKELSPKEPVVCFDEKPIQFLGEIFPRIPAKKPGDIAKYDYEYERRGTANIFSAVEPKAGKHIASVYLRKRGREFAKFSKKISDAYPTAKRIHLVMDNLKTHSEKSLIEEFGEKSGKKLWNRFIVHYTPKHASWLNQAEIELSVCSKQCLGKRRFGSPNELRKEVSAWRGRANRTKQKIAWKFTTKAARSKFGY